MSLSTFATTQRDKENKTLLTLVIWSFVGSALFHGAILLLQIDPIWNLTQAPEIEDWTEVVVTEEPEVEPIEAPETPDQMPSVDTNSAPEVAVLAPTDPVVSPPTSALPPPPAAPEKAAAVTPPASATPASTTPSAEATTDDKDATEPATVPSPSAQPRNPRPSLFDRLRNPGSLFGTSRSATTGTINRSGRTSGGPASGSGRGNTTGDSKNSSPATTAVGPTTPNPNPAKAPGRAVCVSCPKPNYQGTQGSARVVFDIDSKGNVVNVRLRQSSGDPKTDQATLEAVQKWKFSPSEAGKRGVRRKVTFEEDGSNYQRQNQQRRAEDQQRRAEEQKQREAQRQNQEKTPTRSAEKTPTPPPAASPASQPSPKPASAPPPAPAAETPAAPQVEPPPPPAAEAPPPAPVEPAPPPEPEPVEAPPPAEPTPPAASPQ